MKIIIYIKHIQYQNNTVYYEKQFYNNNNNR